MKMTKKLAVCITGGLSNPGKMPGFAWSIPADICRIGSVLAKTPGSVCSECYALKGRNRIENVKNAQFARWELYQVHTADTWCQAMSFLIAHTGDRYFRWFASGDLQSAEMLDRICHVCRMTPRVKHWLPTRERDTVLQYREEIPANLTIRASGPMIDGPPAEWWHLKSSVSNGPTPAIGGRRCPSHSQGNQCGSCRSCWDKRITWIDYETSNAG